MEYGYLPERVFRQIATINVNALNPDGSLKPLAEQFGEHEMMKALDSNYKAPGPFVVASDCGFKGIPSLESKPVILSMRSLRHVLNKHGASVDALTHLADEIRDNVLCFEHADNRNKITILLDAVSENGHDIISVLRADVALQRVDVASIRSVHGKDLDYLAAEMAHAIAANSRIVFQEKAGNWLETRKSLPGMPDTTRRILSHLQDLFYQNHEGDAPEWLNFLSSVTRGESLEEALRNPDAVVRSAVAFQGYGLELLAGDEDPLVRAAVAAQGYASDILRQDNVPFVRNAVSHSAKHETASEQNDALMQKTGDWSEVQRSVASTAVTEKNDQRLSEQLYQSTKQSSRMAPGPSMKAPVTPDTDARAATQAARAQAGMSRNAPSRKEVR